MLTAVNNPKLFSEKSNIHKYVNKTFSLSNGAIDEESWIKFIYVALRQMTSMKVEAATINHLHAPFTVFMFDCSGSQIYDPEFRDEDSGQLRLNYGSVLV